MENIEQFKQQKKEETLKEIESEIKNMKDLIYDFGVKMNFSEENGDIVTAEKCLQKINEYKKELVIWEDAHKAKVKALITPDDSADETVGNNTLPKMEITSMEEKFSGIIKLVDDAFEQIEKKAETEKRFQQQERVGGKYFHRIEVDPNIVKIENKVLEDTNTKDTTHKPKSLSEKYEESIEKKESHNQDIKNPIQKLKKLREEIDELQKKFQQRHREAEHGGVPLDKKEIENFKNKIEEKNIIINNYINQN